MPAEILGVLDAYFETGTEGVCWAMIEDGKEHYYAGLHVLADGDYLEVLNLDGTVKWEGNIDLDWEVGFLSQQKDFNGELIEVGQQTALGYWINGVQRGWAPDNWAKMFFDRPPCRLTIAERELDLEEDEDDEEEE